MFKYFILLISPVYSQLNNIYFSANIVDNKILLDNNITIMFDLEKSTNNNSMKYIYHDTEKITCYNDIYNISYEMNYDLYSSDYNYLNVSLDITNINDIIIIFNEAFNINTSLNIIEIKNYKIIFDYNSSIHNIGNHIYINFNNCNKNIYNKTIYNFVIRYIL